MTEPVSSKSAPRRVKKAAQWLPQDLRVCSNRLEQHRKVTMAQRTGVLVIEDNRLVRDGLSALLDAQPDFKVVAAAEGPDAGLRRVQETKPRVVLVDAALGNRRSHRFVESVRKTAPEAGVVVMDLLPAEEDVVEFVKAGATGFVAKRASSEELVATVRSVAGGAAVVPPPFTSALFSYIAKRAVRGSAPAATDAARMSKREREVISLIAEGLSNKEIAQRLNLAADTVKSHVHNILEKLALHNRLQIAAHAHKAHASQRDPPIPSR
jgi:DNA-binding NarL/FixJ family response regulator